MKRAKHTNQLLSLLVCLTMVIGLFSGLTIGAGAEDIHGEGWTGLDAGFTGGALATGSYALTADLTLTEPITVAAGEAVTICLQGHVLRTAGGRAIANSGILTLTDGEADTVHYYIYSNEAPWRLLDAYAATGSEVSVAALDTIEPVSGETVVAVSGGVITGSQASAIFNGENAVLQITGGTIAGNASAEGAGLYNECGTVSFSGGLICGNRAEQYAGGICSRYGTMDISDAATVAYNTCTNMCGGVENDGGTLQITGGTIAHNSADYCGGVMNFQESSVLNFTGGSVCENVAEKSGGGFYNYGTLQISDTAVLSGNTARLGGGIMCVQGTILICGGTISGNTTTADGNGGGIYSYYGSVDMSGGTITGNAAAWGGGILSFGGDVKIGGTAAITDNAAAAGNGGGIDNEAGSLTITGGTIRGNTADNGAGVMTTGAHTVITGGTITDNHATHDGGGIYNWNRTGEALLELTGGVVAENTAGRDGGGIYNDSGSVVICSAVRDNTADHAGGGIYNYGTLSVDSAEYISGNRAAICSGVCNDPDDACVMERFTDLKAKAWYHDGVHYCIQSELMNGVSETEFAPNQPLTRAMLVTMLWRLSSRPTSDYEITFTDVAPDMWYTEAIRWAQENDIVTGYDETTFGTNDYVTREQVATILYRYADYNGEELSGTVDTHMCSYLDADDVSAWAKTAMEWAAGSRIINGIDGYLAAHSPATRAQAACMLQRYCTMETE